MSGIKHAGMRPKVAKHLRQATSTKSFVNRTKEDREREHLATDAWAERERAKEPERVERARAQRVLRESGAYDGWD